MYYSCDIHTQIPITTLSTTNASSLHFWCVCLISYISNVLSIQTSKPYTPLYDHGVDHHQRPSWTCRNMLLYQKFIWYTSKFHQNFIVIGPHSQKKLSKFLVIYHSPLTAYTIAFLEVDASMVCMVFATPFPKYWYKEFFDLEYPTSQNL